MLPIVLYQDHDLIVVDKLRGRPNPPPAAGKDAGIKLMEIKRLRENGYRITLLNEKQFWRLAGKGRSSS